MNPFSGILQPEIPEGFKRCRFCFAVKRLDCFAKLHTRKDGHFGKCEDCRKEVLIARQQRRHERHVAAQAALPPKPRKVPQTEAQRKAKRRARYRANREKILAAANERYHTKVKHDPEAKAYQREYHAKRNAKLREIKRLREHATVRVKDSSSNQVTPNWSWLQTQEQS
jgi:hypothetical protein